jgi:hypothetical protein
MTNTTITTFYTVWVGDTEVSDCDMPLGQANKYADFWRDLAFEDVQVKAVTQ